MGDRDCKSERVGGRMVREVGEFLVAVVLCSRLVRVGSHLLRLSGEEGRCPRVDLASRRRDSCW